MSIAMILASALVVQAPAANEAAVEVAYPEMRAGRSAAAINKIEHADARDANHPARLINLGIAYARVGQTDKAREAFEQAATSEDRYRLETASGEWLDSRDLAREALAMLERGDFSTPRFAAR
jgi:Tfp pilus assembly protein PilF